MHVLRALLVLAMAAQVAAAVWIWPLLPERIPVHFDALGVPDGFAARDGVEWFVVPALLLVFGGVFGFLLPPWMRHLARTSSPWLNVPKRARFLALSPEARVRAVAAPAGWLVVIAIEMQVLVLFLLWGTLQIARGDWQRLPPVVTYGLLGALLGTAIVLAVAGSRAVQREIDAAAA